MVAALLVLSGGYAHVVYGDLLSPAARMVTRPLAPEIEAITRDVPRVVVADAYVTMTDEEAGRAIGSRRIDLRRTVILERAPAEPPLESTSGGAADAAVIRVAEKNRVTIEANVSGARLLVLHDLYGTGWEATVDGRRVPIERANVAFRAVSLREGIHIVDFRYRPRALTYGVIAVALALVLVWAISRSG